MSNAYKDLQQRAPLLALTTIFDAKDERDIICDILHLGVELEKIIEIASEPMLAMIRMQWWLDALGEAQTSDDVSPLAMRLNTYSSLDKKALISAIQQSQDTLQSPSPYVDWLALFKTIDLSVHWGTDEAVLEVLGRNMCAIYHEAHHHIYQPLSDRDIKRASARPHGVFRLLNLLCQRHMDDKAGADPLLVLRFLWRIIR